METWLWPLPPTAQSNAERSERGTFDPDLHTETYETRELMASAPSEGAEAPGRLPRAKQQHPAFTRAREAASTRRSN